MLRGVLCAAVMMAATVPVAGTSSAAFASTPSAPLFGVMGGKLAPYASQAAALGARRAVVRLEWRQTQPTPTSPIDLASIDRQVSTLGAHGITSQIRIYTCAENANGTPFWGTLPEPAFDVHVRPHGNCTTMPPSSPALLTHLVSTIVSHYRQFRYPVTDFAFENEINDHTQWPGAVGHTACTTTSCAPFDLYMADLQVARAAAHAANPDARMFDSGLGGGASWARPMARMIYESAGKTDAALQAAARYINTYAAYRHDPSVHPYGLWFDPSNVALLRSTLVPLMYAISDPAARPPLPDDGGDRAYYVVRHLYADPSKLDGVQLHNYDGIDEWPRIIAYVQSQLRGAVPVQCWECGIYAPLTAVGTHGVTVHLVPDDVAGNLVKRGVEAIGGGISEVIHLPLTWSSPPPAKGAQAIPLLCGTPGTKYETVMCPGNVPGPSPMGRAYTVMTRNLVSCNSPTRITTFGANVIGYRFVVPGGHLSVMWSTSHTWVTADITKLGTIRSVTNEYGAETTQSHRAYRFAQNPVYIHTT